MSDFACRVRYRNGDQEKVFEIPLGRDPFEVMERARAKLFPEVTAEQIAANSARLEAILATRPKRKEEK
jgi:hypothetical protein